MRRRIIAGLMAVALAAPATAQLARDAAALTEAQLKTALFGIEMTGFSPTYNFSWRECIQPNGETMYYTPEGVMRGRLTITNTGLACFAYEDDGYTTPACYKTKQTDKGFRFEGDFNSLFITTRVVKGVKTCRTDDLVG
jgi:hypothetical protein